MLTFGICLEVSDCILKSWSLVPCLAEPYWIKTLSLSLDLVSFQMERRLWYRIREYNLVSHIGEGT